MAKTATAIRKEIRALGNPAIAEHSQRFFKTGKGEYGEGDRFLGIRVPIIRQQVRCHSDAPLEVILMFLKSRWHEERLFALLAMVDRFSRGSQDEREAIFNLYLENLRYVNNWDLVDSSAHLIVGPWLEPRSRRLLYTMAKSQNLWERRVAVMATGHFIRCREFSDTLAIAVLLLNDKHDLIHKAVGWMLREVGKRDRQVETGFLKKHYKAMPRTMLRYAIEKFPEKERQRWFQGKV
jgi:3-methyladenine DNA glycosylase AlkD